MKSMWLMPIKTNNRLIDPKLKLNVLRQIEMADGKGGGYLWVQIAPTTKIFAARKKQDEREKISDEKYVADANKNKQ